MAVGAELRSVAFPSLSTGAYRFPIGEAAPIALGTVTRFDREHPGALDLIRFVLFSASDLNVYRHSLEKETTSCVRSS